MDLGQGRYLAVKNVFVPLYVNGRRWGNFEVAYRDEGEESGATSPSRGSAPRRR